MSYSYYECRACHGRFKLFKTLESLKATRFKNICAPCIVKITDVEEFNDKKTARLGGYGGGSIGVQA